MTLNVGVPDERYRQLHLLAKKSGLSLADVIGDLVNGAIRAGKITDQLPGWTVDSVASHVVFATEDGIERVWTCDVALGVANALEQLALPAGRTKATLDLDANLKLARLGLAVRLTCVDTGAERVVARSIAEELAALIRKAARR